MKLMLLSNSTMAGEPYLAWAAPHLRRFLEGVSEALFIPYAAADRAYDAYTARVASALGGLRLTGIHTTPDKSVALARAGAIVVGGGNTFCLLHHCQETGILPAMRAAIQSGARFAGWSAGANLACPTIKTTNDMPIVDTHGLDALGLVHFQINPHFTTQTVPGHGGESRAQRIQEFLLRNPTSPVLGLPEGMLVDVQGGMAVLQGDGTATWFASGAEPAPCPPNTLIACGAGDPGNPVHAAASGSLPEAGG